jgi:Fe-S cluster biogenesis protein NfuA
MDAARQRFVALCRDVLRPLIEADDGKLYLVSVTEGQLTLHLGGSCSGCPGASLTIRTLIEPAVRAIDPNVRVVVTVGAKQPEDAVLVEAAPTVP